MITAGVDMGSQKVKVVIIENGRILSQVVASYTGDAGESAEQALREALGQVGLPREAIARIVSTGVGRAGVAFADEYYTDITCDARGAAYLCSTARTVIDIGAEDCRVIKCEGSGKVLDFTKNDKCAAGTGVFIDLIAKILEVPTEQVEELARQSQKEIALSSTCAVFGESEVISLIHKGEPKAAILRGLLAAIASRTAGLTYRIGVEKEVFLMGGVARNNAFCDLLAKELGITPIVASSPDTVGALGAALMAREGKKQ